MDQEIRGSDSFWAPYIRTLPGLEFLDDMLEPDERWIAGTNLKLSIIEQLQKWKAMYEVRTNCSQWLVTPGWGPRRSELAATSSDPNALTFTNRF